MGEQTGEKKHICVGLLAHVDAGKTTLSEGLLYCGGCLRKLGRVDHRDAFLDTDALEKERGITIFSKQALLELPDASLTLLDTPGHVDFSGEMERTLQVLDYAVLVVSGTDGVQSHTHTVWKLLERYDLPVFLFVNKMDLPGADRAALLDQLRQRLGEQVVDFSAPADQVWEEAAMQEESAMEEYLASGSLQPATVARLVAGRKVFPCYFGAALRLEGVEQLLEGLRLYTRMPAWPAEFAARVYKISRDPQGARLTWLKVTGGVLRVKALLTGQTQGETWQEKADQIRLYSGARFTPAEQAQAGTVCAVTGLSKTWAGQGLGCQSAADAPLLQPVLSCQLLLPEGADVHTALMKLSQLEEEDPQLHIVWNEPLQQIQLQMMGQVQLDVLKRLIWERFGLSVGFGPGRILYKETIADTVEGIGHFEPLRHYAEVHLLLEPGAPGSGLQFAADCPEDQLDKNWQRLVMTHRAEKEHLGVLTGSPITDMRITLVAGRAHLKHTEGGDFRQATYRAVRQGLMQAKSVLLEPWYEFSIELPAAQVGRAISDLQRMGGEFDPPETAGDTAVLQGFAPAAGLQEYPLELTGYTRGQGHIACSPAGYRPCHNAAEVIAQRGYEPLRDVENPTDSVFCSHGAGYSVPWDEVPAKAHVDSGLRLRAADAVPEPPSRPARQPASAADDAELAAIFERTYGPVRRRELFRTQPDKPAEYQYEDQGPEYLLVDGYNIIFAWDELKELARTSLEAARQALADLLCNYQGFRKCAVILVFDAYKVRHGAGEVSRYHNIHVVYTREAETADMYIEKVTYQLAGKRRVRVATSDGAEQLIILGHGAMRVSAKSFHREVELANMEIRAIIEQNSRKNGGV